MARFSSRTGRWHGQRRVNAPVPETIRDERQWATEMPGGMIRVDMGAPVPRLPNEPQPVSVGRTGGTALATSIEAAAQPESIAVRAPSEPRQRPWHDGYGLGRAR